MKRTLATTAMVSAFLLTSATGAPVSMSGEAPIVDGADISMLDMTNATGQGKFWSHEGFAAGQTFATGSDPGYNLNAVTIRYAAGGTATKTYDVRVGTLTPDVWDGDNKKSFNLISSEMFVQDSDAADDVYLTFTFDSPVPLNPNTEYCFDVHMANSTTAWQTGIPTIYRDAGNDNYAGGERYNMSSFGGPTKSWELEDLETATQASGDWIFHLDIDSTIPKAFALRITPNASTSGNYDFSWDSKARKVYDLVSDTSLATDPSGWAVWDGNADIDSGGGTTMLENIPSGDLARFFAIVEKDPPAPAVQNGSFEDPVTGDGGFTVVAPPNWTEFDPGNAGDVGIWNPSAVEHATVPDGENAGQMYNSGIPMAVYGLSQVLGENFAENTNYEITVEVGRSTVFAWPGYRVELWAGSTMIAEDDNIQSPAVDAWATSTVTYTYDAGDVALAGEALEIRLLSLGEDPNGAGAGEDFSVEFDDVTFTSTGP